MNATWLDIGLLGRVRAIVAPWPCCLVGGAVRDHLLGRGAYDLDLVTVGPEPAEALARELPARLVPIGGDRFAATRLVAEDGVIDLWDRERTPLVDELARRDLTINAIAVDLADGTVHDPHGGRRDLERRLLRATTEHSFADDPLRVLRLARLAAELVDFEVDESTLELARAAVPGLSSVAAERRRDEFGRSLRAAAPQRALAVWLRVAFYPQFLDRAGADGPAAAPAAFERGRRAAEDFARYDAGRPRVDADSDADPAPDPDPFTLYGALLLAAAGAEVDDLLRGGYASRREARDLALVLPHRRLPADTAEQRWLLHRSGHCWPTALCFAAAVAEQPSDAEAVKRRLANCIALARDQGAEIFNPPPLVRGDEIRRLLDLESGPEIGLAARRLRRRQVEGRLTDREEALRWLLSERRSSGAG